MSINRKAIIQGTAVFAVLYFIHLMFLPVLAKSIEHGDGGIVYSVHQVLGILTCLLSGYVAARIAGERGFFYGLNVGALGTVLSALAALLWAAATGAKTPSLGMLPFWIFVNGSLAGFAGMLTMNLGDNAKRQRREKNG